MFPNAIPVRYGTDGISVIFFCTGALLVYGVLFLVTLLITD